MPDTPRSELTKVRDPLRDFRGKPALSDAGSGNRYVGRVTLEVWEIAGASADGPEGIAISVDPATGRDAPALLRRVAKYLPKHLEELAKDHEKAGS